MQVNERLDEEQLEKIKKEQLLHLEENRLHAAVKIFVHRRKTERSEQNRMCNIAHAHDDIVNNK